MPHDQLTFRRGFHARPFPFMNYRNLEWDRGSGHAHFGSRGARYANEDFRFLQEAPENGKRRWQREKGGTEINKRNGITLSSSAVVFWIPILFKTSR
jgi:hypothetical protein